MIRPEDVTIEESRDGVRIIVDDRESDSLAVIEVRNRYGSLAARVGLRGNFSAFRRPMRWVITHMPAPPVSPATLQQRKDAARERIERGVFASERSRRILRGEE